MGSTGKAIGMLTPDPFPHLCHRYSLGGVGSNIVFGMIAFCLKETYILLAAVRFH